MTITPVTLDIGMDVDNVIYPWATVVTRWIEERKHLPSGSLDDIALTWTWYRDQWGMSGEEFGEHFTAGVKAGVVYTLGDPTEGSVSALRRLADAGHRIHYITNRALPEVPEYVAWKLTRRWLAGHGFPITSVHVSADKHVIPTDVFLDDSPENIDALLDSGHPAPILWARPHNLAARRSHRYRWVSSWHEFEAAVSILTPVTYTEDHGTLDDMTSEAAA